jgi:hypothetical protein
VDAENVCQNTAKSRRFGEELSISLRQASDAMPTQGDLERQVRYRSCNSEQQE